MKKTRKQARASRQAPTVRVVVPSILGFEKLAMDAVTRLARMAGLGKNRTEDLCTAVAEACLNAMQHGNQLSAHKNVDILFYLEDEALEVEIYDNGGGMEDHPPAPVLERKLAKKETPRGWGIFLIENLVDEVEFGISSQHGHVTRLVMRLDMVEVA